MIDVIKKMIKIIQRESALLLKQPALIAIALIAPIFYGFFYTGIYFHKSENDIPIAIVDNDNSAFSRNFIRAVDEHQMIKVAQLTPEIEEARQLLSQLKVFGILCLPENAEKNLKQGKQIELRFFINASRFLVANDLNRAMNEIILTMNAGIRLRFFETKGFSKGQAIALALPLNLDIRPLFNSTESYSDFFIPGILLVIWQQTFLMALALSFIHEREARLLSGLFELADNNPGIVIFGKSMYYMLLWLIYALFYYAVIFRYFKMIFSANFMVLFALTLTHLLALVGLGLFLASFFKQKITGLQFFIFTSYPFFLLSGFSWPIHSMPVGLQWLAQILPSTPFFQSVVRVTQMGASWRHIWPALLHLGLLALAGFILTWLRINKWKSMQADLSENVSPSDKPHLLQQGAGNSK
ncbi:ABC transporter permease [candidate division KSB1 bacterium]|nr:ABC transporter permease [candidate division KSB1 bacterium]